MPTYEYECTHCGHGFEAFQNINAKPLTICPKCRNKVKRIISAGAGIIFKGPGFYATDYRKGSDNSKPQHRCPKANEGCGGCSQAQ